MNEKSKTDDIEKEHEEKKYLKYCYDEIVKEETG